MSSDIRIHTGRATAYTVPTDSPEGDGTFTWDTTTLVLVELEAADTIGVGYTYTHAVAAPLARDLIKNCVLGTCPSDIGRTTAAILRAQRNYGSSGIAATALSAIDLALWDLHSKLLGKPLVDVLGRVRDAAPVYGSGGFTTYSDIQLSQQLGGWVNDRISMVKMKVGADPPRDPDRVAVARRAIGPETQLFVDANGAYSRKQALAMAERFHGHYGVVWFEEPVSSDDPDGLHLLCLRAPAGMEIAAGEYAWRNFDLRTLLAAGAVDVLQADATRCGGVTGFLEAAALAATHNLSLSAHCGPTAHLHLACAATPLRHVEYFHDHVRIESMLFDGFVPAKDGVMRPDLSRPGLGVTFKHQDAERFRHDL